LKSFWEEFKVDTSKFYVVAVISNPARFKTRVRLFQQFQAHMKGFGVNLVVAELAFGDRPFEVTDPANPLHIRLRGFDELWHKENLINIAISRLPSDWEYVAWIDGDVAFTNPNWAVETVHQLQHHMVVQLFSECVDLGPKHEALKTHQGFVKQYQASVAGDATYDYWHSGYAWAARREAAEGVGGLIETSLGSADHHMALSLIGKGEKSLPGGIHPNYAKQIFAWQDRAEAIIRRDIGFTPGLITHFWHGKKKDRKYIERWDILTKNNFDPEKHTLKDTQGLLKLSHDVPHLLRDQIRHYFRQRNEDSVDNE
jgi:hypothetical protein